MRQHTAAYAGKIAGLVMVAAVVLAAGGVHPADAANATEIDFDVFFEYLELVNPTGHDLS